jgi:hypothetical protein
LSGKAPQLPLGGAGVTIAVQGSMFVLGALSALGGEQCRFFPAPPSLKKREFIACIPITRTSRLKSSLQSIAPKSLRRPDSHACLVVKRGASRSRTEVEMTRRMQVFAVAIGGVLVATPSAGQQPAAMVGSEARAGAEALEAQAKELYTQPLRYREAASLHVRAAELREAGDPLRVKNLQQAARLYYYAGKKTKAQSLMERAGEEALSTGDIMLAARTLLDASAVAQDLRRGADVLRIVERVRLLMASPLIAASDREDVLKRITAAGQ